MGKAGVGGASGVPPFFLFPFWAFRSAPSGKVRSWGAPRETSRAVGLGRGASLPFLRWLRTLGRVVVGGSPLGGFWGSALGAWGFWPFSLSARPFSLLFGRKARSIRRRFGCSSANYRRLNGVALVALSSQSSPFRRLLRPGPFPSSYTRVGARPSSSPLRRAKVPDPRNFAASPCESWPGPPNFTASPWKSPPGRPVFHFAVRKSTTPPGFPTSPWRSSPLRRGKVRQTTRFSTSPCESPPGHPVFHFAVRKSTSPPGFPLRHGELPQFALVKPPRGVSIPTGPPGATAAPSRVNFRQIPAPGV